MILIVGNVKKMQLDITCINAYQFWNQRNSIEEISSSILMI